MRRRVNVDQDFPVLMRLPKRAVSKLPAWFDLAVLMLSEEKKRCSLRPWEEVQNRLKSVYETIFAWKTKGLWVIRDKKGPQNCQMQALSLCTVLSLVHWQGARLLPSVGRWLGLGGRGLSEKGMRRLLGHRGVDLHPYYKGLYWRKRSSPWGSTSADNLINAAVLSASKDLIHLVPAGRSRVQLWEENIFDCKSPCETSLGE